MRTPQALELIGLVQVPSVVLLALSAGHTADRFDHKRIMNRYHAAVGAALL